MKKTLLLLVSALVSVASYADETRSVIVQYLSPFTGESAYQNTINDLVIKDDGTAVLTNVAKSGAQLSFNTKALNGAEKVTANPLQFKNAFTGSALISAYTPMTTASGENAKYELYGHDIFTVNGEASTLCWSADLCINPSDKSGSYAALNALKSTHRTYSYDVYLKISPATITCITEGAPEDAKDPCNGFGCWAVFSIDVPNPDAPEAKYVTVDYTLDNAKLTYGIQSTQTEILYNADGSVSLFNFENSGADVCFNVSKESQAVTFVSINGWKVATSFTAIKDENGTGARFALGAIGEFEVTYNDEKIMIKDPVYSGLCYIYGSQCKAIFESEDAENEYYTVNLRTYLNGKYNYEPEANVTKSLSINGGNAWATFKIALPKSSQSGIENVIVNDSNAPAEYYNLQGIRMNGDALAPGVYVKRQGNATSKILVK